MIVKTQTVEFDVNLKLQCGTALGPITLAYETYGERNAARNNAILILHALSGNAHAAGRHSANDRKLGWWDNAIGPGKAFDTNHYYIVCSNVLGGCGGSTGPASIDPKRGKPYGASFPVITVDDMVNAQYLLMKHLGITQWRSVAGGSMGGMQALQWARAYPEATRSAIVLASTARVSAQSIAFNKVARQAIYADPKWNGGDYYDSPDKPDAGLSVARMVGHITYLSEDAMREKFGRRLQDKSKVKYGYESKEEFEVESYLNHQGNEFTKRFDANSFITITRAIDYFDLSYGLHSLSDAFKSVKARMLVVSYSSDWLYPPKESEDIVRALLQNGVDTTYVKLETKKGHDAFLLEDKKLENLTRTFLERVEGG